MLRVECFGIAGADPERFEIENGSRWCKLSVASSKKIKGEYKTTWFEFRFWNYACDYVCKYVRKGDRVAIYNADLTAYKYKDESGKDRTMWHGVNGQIEVLPKKSGTEEPPTAYDEFANESWF